MKPIRRILVAIKDVQRRQQPGMARALQIARAFGASVELYHAIDAPVYVDFELTDCSLAELKRRRSEEVRQSLEVLAAESHGQGVWTNIAVEWDHPAHQAIVRHALRTRADLIISECHSGRRLAPWLLHLTDWELLRISPVPVLLVKSGRPYEQPTILAAIDPYHAHAKPAKLDEQILSYAARWAQALGGSLHAVHAYAPAPVGTASQPAGAVLRRHKRSGDKARLAIARLVGKAKISSRRWHAVRGEPIDAICETTESIGASVVVMGAVSRSGLRRVFIGNTAEQVLPAVTCDVLVVKPKQFKSGINRAQLGVRLVMTPQMLYTY